MRSEDVRARERVFRVEALEERALLAASAETFTCTGISGETVNFTVDGTAAGPATTNSSGVATLTGIATSDPVGTHPDAVAVAFAGNTSYTSSNGTGTLTVS
jgi:hypothetical protein